jgi:hypothetical protein
MNFHSTKAFTFKIQSKSIHKKNFNDPQKNIKREVKNCKNSKIFLVQPHPQILHQVFSINAKFASNPLTY